MKIKIKTANYIGIIVIILLSGFIILLSDFNGSNDSDKGYYIEQEYEVQKDIVEQEESQDYHFSNNSTYREIPLVGNEELEFIEKNVGKIILFTISIIVFQTVFNKFRFI